MAKPVKYLLLAVSILLLIAAVQFLQLSRYGLSAHDEPTKPEVLLARALRRWATPADLRDARNPLPATPEVLAEAKAHFADTALPAMGTTVRGRRPWLSVSIRALRT